MGILALTADERVSS